MWYEYVRDTAPLAHEQGLQNVLVTNGYILSKPLLELLPHIDAMNIDLKSFQPDFYRQICSGQLEPVKTTIALALEAGCHVEVTTLLVTDCNDSPAEVAQLAQWLAALNPQTPLHLSRYFPRYQMERPATPLETLERAWQVARAHLDYVYLGNVQLGSSDTLCPHCSQVLIQRPPGFPAQIIGLEKKNCRRCGSVIPVLGVG